jgi:putative heme-binding domain-containing protein
MALLGLAGLALAVTGGAYERGAEEPPVARLALQHGDHVCIIGNTLAERMQHDGWLETLLQARFPAHELVFRDLGFSGDELSIRVRDLGFGDTDHHLTFSKADVVFAFFGYNESFGDRAGLPKFRRDLDEFIEHTLAQKYNGKAAPRLVLCSPIAHEDLHDRNLPDGRQNNRRIEMYTAAMAETARARRIPFVDLYQPTRADYAKSSQPLTIDGVHLNEHGNHVVAQAIDRALFGDRPARELGADRLEKLRRAVRDKNFYWWNRYRTVDGYSIYGGRADLAFVDGQTNRVVVEREMQVLDVMTSNRDRRIWALARGGDLKVDDSNCPPFIPVKTNKPGPGPHGEHMFLSGEEAIRHMKLGKGLKVNLFASEKEFPELAKPVQMAFDTRGRLWVAVMPSYPHWKPGEEMNDKILILEDTDGDGKADKCTVFADHLHVPTGLEFWNNGVFVGLEPDLVFMKDTDGDDRADVRIRVLDGIDSADTHHALNSFVLDPGGGLYFQEGTFLHTQVETPYGPPVRCADAGVYRYEPRTHKFETYASYAFANPHGHVFDHWGQDFVTDGTSNINYYAAPFSGRVEFPAKHPHLRSFFAQRTRPCPATEILSSRHFPPEFQGDYLDGNVIGFQGILRYQITDDDAGFAAREMEPIVYSDDPNFRPSDIEIGPDGAIYFLDWQNPIIGHMQHNLRDPSRDRTHGRIYRITYEGRPLLAPAKIAGEPIEKLLELLKEPEDRVRYRARIELSGRDGDQVVAAARRWAAGLDPSDSEHEHHLLEALWLHQSHNVVNEDLLKRVLGSPDYRARAAATRVLGYWRDRVGDTLYWLKKLAADPHPRVRLEAVRAASFLTSAEAVEVALVSAELPSDYWIDYTRREALKTLQPYYKEALKDGRLLASATDAGARLLLHGQGTTELLRMKPHRAVYRELLWRKGVRDEDRTAAAASLARMEHKHVVEVLLDAVHRLDKEPDGDETVIFDLVRLLSEHPATELASMRSGLERTASLARRPVTRQLGFVALVAADGRAEPAWQLATHSASSLRDLVDAMPLIRDPNVRAALYPRVAPLLDGLPKPLSASSGEAEAIRRSAMNALTYVRGQELPTFKALARFIRAGVDRDAAVRAILRIPSTYWPADDARPLADVILAHVRGLPANKRTTPAALDAMQLGEALAALLPATEAQRVRRELGELGVRVIRLATVPDQMLYDQDRLVVQAGKPVEIHFENNDLMPHNFVLTRPGALEEVGLLAEATGTLQGALERNYVPSSDRILVASRLLAPREKQKLSFTAPREPGIYPYVCTFPGHWRRMFGALYVVADYPEYAVDPEGYLARRPLTAADPLLKYLRPRKEWTFADLAPAVEGIEGGRSFANARHLFEVANCVACHRLNGAGHEIGPDLAKLDLTQKPLDILRALIEPSAKIDDKYATYIFELESGKLVSGLVLKETPDAVRVVENPLEKSEPIVLKPSEIVERRKSPTSMMPKGLLDKFTREEILDLVAYIIARGDARHPLFAGAHNHAKAGHPSH